MGYCGKPHLCPFLFPERGNLLELAGLFESRTWPVGGYIDRNLWNYHLQHPVSRVATGSIGRGGQGDVNGKLSACSSSRTGPHGGRTRQPAAFDWLSESFDKFMGAIIVAAVGAPGSGGSPRS